MPTIADLIKEVATIRELVEMIEIKGNKNAQLILAAYNRCNGLIDTLNDAANKIQQTPKEGSEVGEDNG